MIHLYSVTVQCVLSFRAPRLCSLAKNEAKLRPRFRSDSNAVPDSSRNEWPQTGSVYSSTRRRSNSASIASKTISAGITARLVQRMIAARAATRYSVMQTLLSMRDVGQLDGVGAVRVILRKRPISLDKLADGRSNPCPWSSGPTSDHLVDS